MIRGRCFWAKNAGGVSGKVFERWKICEKFGKSYKKQGVEVARNAKKCVQSWKILF